MKSPSRIRELRRSALIANSDTEQALAFEAGLFLQKTRLTGAERVLVSGKPTDRKSAFNWPIQSLATFDHKTPLMLIAHGRTETLALYLMSIDDRFFG